MVRLPPPGAPKPPSPPAGSGAAKTNAQPNAAPDGGASAGIEESEFDAQPGALRRTDAPLVGQVQPGPGAAVGVRIAGAIRARAEKLADNARAAGDVLGPGVEDHVEDALVTSTHRVTTALFAGRISSDEATRSLDMLEEMLGALIALHAGEVQVQVSTELSASSDMRGFLVTTTEGDVLRVAVRPRGVDGGQARVKLESVVDDGVATPKPDRFMIRFDLEGSRVGDDTEALVDLEFGRDRPGPEKVRLDTRVHGVMLTPDGQPVLNRGGRPVADHHFPVGSAGALDDPDAFAAFADDFLSKLFTMAGAAG